MLRRGLSPSTVLEVHRIFSRALRIAVRRGRISRNVAALADAPSALSGQGTPAVRSRRGSPGGVSAARDGASDGWPGPQEPGPSGPRGSLRRLDQAPDRPAAETAELAGSSPVCCSLMRLTRAASDRSVAAPLRESCFPRMYSAPEWSANSGAVAAQAIPLAAWPAGLNIGVR